MDTSKPYEVYVIQSEGGKYYIGLSEDINKRLKEHNAGLSNYTKTKRPWTLVHIEKFETLSLARQREKQIKFWKNSNNFTATTWVAGDYLIMTVTNQHPHYLVQIHDATLAHNMREMFKGIWNVEK